MAKMQETVIVAEKKIGIPEKFPLISKRHA